MLTSVSVSCIFWLPQNLLGGTRPAVTGRAGLGAPLPSRLTVLTCQPPKASVLLPASYSSLPFCHLGFYIHRHLMPLVSCTQPQDCYSNLTIPFLSLFLNKENLVSYCLFHLRLKCGCDVCPYPSLSVHKMLASLEAPHLDFWTRLESWARAEGALQQRVADWLLFSSLWQSKSQKQLKGEVCFV